MKRYNPELTNRMTQQAALALCALVFWYLMTSCTPLAMYQDPATPRPAATVTPIGVKSPTPSPAPTVCIVTGLLNLRIQPNTQGVVIRVLSAGERLTVIERGAWLQVTDSRGNHGHVNARYCEIGE